MTSQPPNSPLRRRLVYTFDRYKNTSSSRGWLYESREELQLLLTRRTISPATKSHLQKMEDGFRILIMTHQMDERDRWWYCQVLNRHNLMRMGDFLLWHFDQDLKHETLLLMFRELVANNIRLRYGRLSKVGPRRLDPSLSSQLARLSRTVLPQYLTPLESEPKWFKEWSYRSSFQRTALKSFNIIAKLCNISLHQVAAQFRDRELEASEKSTLDIAMDGMRCEDVVYALVRDRAVFELGILDIEHEQTRAEMWAGFDKFMKKYFYNIRTVPGKVPRELSQRPVSYLLSGQEEMHEIRDDGTTV